LPRFDLVRAFGKRIADVIERQIEKAQQRRAIEVFCGRIAERIAIALRDAIVQIVKGPR